MPGKLIAEMSRAERLRVNARRREQRAARAPEQLTRILVVPDAHHPYVNKRAWSCVLEVRKRMQPERTVIIGDFWDCYALSSHAKDPRRRRADETLYEIERTNEAGDELQAASDGEIDFVEGNHETRLTRWIAQHAPELNGFRGLSVREALRIDERGWGWTPYKQSLQIGQMHLTHDLERSGVNACRQSLIDYGSSITIGHTHGAGVVYLGGHVGLNVGWLGDLESIDYRHTDLARRQWQLGFGWITQTPDGLSWAQFIPILNDRCVVDGQLIRGAL
jgi:predicted phosphodiesterase